MTLKSPIGIAVSRTLNKLFWTQKGRPKGSDGRIFAASLDVPAGRTARDRDDIELIIDGLPECIDLDIDDENGILFWTDRGELPLGNTLNKKHLSRKTPAAEQMLGRQIVSFG